MNPRTSSLGFLDAYTRIPAVMSNFDGEIDLAIAEKLRSGPYWAPYPACDFYGMVWWRQDLECWACEIFRHGQSVDTLYAEDLPGIMEQARRRYGSR